MRNSHWFRRLEIALEFDSGFEIFLLLGRGELARPALTGIAAQLQRFGAPHWHRLHLDGLDTLLTDKQPEAVLHLVHGFERMPEATAVDTAARLNLNRDRLEVLRGPVIFWIPEDFYEELLRQAPDFVAWRSQATVVPDADIGASSEVIAEQFLLCEAHKTTTEALCEVPPLDVLDAGDRKPILDWLAEGSARSLCYEVEDSPLRIMSWCAGQLARRRDDGDYDKVPVLLPSVLLALAKWSDGGEGLVEGIAGLWESNALHVIVAAPVTGAERDSLVERAGENRVLVAVHDEPEGCVSVAPLGDRQAQWAIDDSLFLPPVPPVPLACVFDVLAQPKLANLARSLYEFGCRAGGKLRAALLRTSICLYRTETRPHPPGGLVEAMLALAEFEEELPIWSEAVMLARALEPPNLELLIDALAGLGFAQHLAGDDAEAERTVQEALLLASQLGRRTVAITGLHITLGYVLHEQGRFAEALAITEQALHELDDVPDTDDSSCVELLDIAEMACMSMGLEERALEFAARRSELWRTRPDLRLLELTRLAQRLLELGELNRALSTLNDAIDLLLAEDDVLPYRGQAHPLILLAEIHRSLDDRERAIAAMREAIRVYRAVIADGGPPWSTTELAEALLTLAGDLQHLDRAEALDHLLEAVDILEQVEHSSYPADLANALTELGDYAAIHKRFELATAAYARVLALADPFPARTSEPILEIERRLHEVCHEFGITVDDALARGRQPITITS